MNPPSLLCTVDNDDETRRSVDAIGKVKSLPTVHYDRLAAFLANGERNATGCVVCELCLPDGDGLDLLKSLKTEGFRLELIFYTAHANTRTAVQAIQGGAITLLEKPTSLGELMDEIHTAVTASERREAERLRRLQTCRRFDSLNHGERLVLEGLLVGRPNKEMAVEQGVAVRTIEARRHQVHAKTQTKSLAELLRLAFLHLDDVAKQSVAN